VHTLLQSVRGLAHVLDVGQFIGSPGASAAGPPGEDKPQPGLSSPPPLRQLGGATDVDGGAADPPPPSGRRGGVPATEELYGHIRGTAPVASLVRVKFYDLLRPRELLAADDSCGGTGDSGADKTEVAVEEEEEQVEEEEDDEEALLDYPRILNDLLTAGYRGYLSIVYEGKDRLDPFVAVPRAAAVLRRHGAGLAGGTAGGGGGGGGPPPRL
jgi:hypothetical protein